MELFSFTNFYKGVNKLIKIGSIMNLTNIAVLSLILIMLTGFSAAQIEGAQTTAGNNETSTTSGTGNVTIQAGSVASVDLSQNSLTEKWAGFYGTISGSKVLGSASDNLYTWTANSFSDAKVVATPQGDPVPTGVNTVNDPNSFLGGEFNSGVANASTTFNRTDSISLFGSSTSTAAVDTFNSSQQRSDRFTTFLYENADQANEPVYVAEGSSLGPGFNNDNVNYQMLVGVGDSASQKTYSFYLELP